MHFRPAREHSLWQLASGQPKQPAQWADTQNSAGQRSFPKQKPAEFLPEIARENSNGKRVCKSNKISSFAKEYLEMIREQRILLLNEPRRVRYGLSWSGFHLTYFKYIFLRSNWIIVILLKSTLFSTILFYYTWADGKVSLIGPTVFLAYSSWETH